MKDFNDFTEAHYKKILKTAQEKYEFVFFEDKNKKKPHIIMRHDVDFSVNRALRLAEIERDCQVKSTFFLRLHSEFYNLFEKEIHEKIKEIMKLKHKIGLHFEGEFYKNFTNKLELEKKLSYEKKILEKEFSCKILSFSFHNPEARNLMRFDDYKLATMINTYSKKIQESYKYCSDSNGYWRHERIFDVIKEQKHEKIHVLTHPEWWQKKPMSPKEKVNRAIKFRAQNQLKAYMNLLKSVGRKDVG